MSTWSNTLLTPEMIETLDLQPILVTPPLIGERSVSRYSGSGGITVYHHNFMCRKAHALTIWNHLPPNHKANPPSEDAAMAYAQIADAAGIEIPQSIRDQLPAPGSDNYQEFFVTVLSPGSMVIPGAMKIKQFIVFIWVNTVPQFRMRYSDMTGREQYEWTEAWKHSSEGFHQNEQRTLGLVGTDLHSIRTSKQLRDCLNRSPSLRNRRPRHHILSKSKWEQAAVDVFA